MRGCGWNFCFSVLVLATFFSYLALVVRVFAFDGGDVFQFCNRGICSLALSGG